MVKSKNNRERGYVRIILTVIILMLSAFFTQTFAYTNAGHKHIPGYNHLGSGDIDTSSYASLNNKADYKPPYDYLQLYKPNRTFSPDKYVLKGFDKVSGNFGIMQFDGTRKYADDEVYCIYKDYFDIKGVKYDLKLSIKELTIHNNDKSSNRFELSLLYPDIGFNEINHDIRYKNPCFGGGVHMKVEILKNGKVVKNPAVNFVVSDLDSANYAKDLPYDWFKQYKDANLIEGFRFPNVDMNKVKYYKTAKNIDLAITKNGGIIGTKNNVTPEYFRLGSPEWRTKALFFEDNLFDKNGALDIIYEGVVPGTGNMLIFSLDNTPRGELKINKAN